MGCVRDADEYLTIGVLARASGLTATALRFYDDCGLLPPARVDAVTGYRYYSPEQRERAVTIRRLREIEVPLDTVAAVLAGDAERAGRLLDTHVDGLERRARAAAAAVASIKAALRGDGPDGVTLCTADLVEAIEQVRSTVARDAEIPVLTGIFIESDSDAVTLTATDRYRLSTRALAPARASERPWSLVVRAHDLVALTETLLGTDQIRLAPAEDALLLAADGVDHRCPAIDEPFPDYRTMLAVLAPARTRVVVNRNALLAAVRDAGDETLRCDIDAEALTMSTHAPGIERRIPAVVNGSRLVLSFDPATLAPAIHCAVGPEVMLDVADPAQPVVIRSAASGDLTTLAMPCRSDASPA